MDMQYLSASYQSSLMKSVIRGALASQSQRDRTTGGEGGTGGREEMKREDMACLREEESDGISSGTMNVKNGFLKKFE